jgi:hypothetical protein
VLSWHPGEPKTKPRSTVAALHRYHPDALILRCDRGVPNR